MKNKKIIISVIALFIVCGFVGVKFINHENKQNERINKLQEEIQGLKEQNDTLIEDINNLKKQSPINWTYDTYNYLAIGNSITKHGLADYWWNSNNGMAATTTESDYVHLVNSYLESKKGKVMTEAFGFAIWETLAHDRAETLENLDKYLSKNINLITIQLGENVSSLETFESDFEYLINYIKDRVPNARIMVIGDFWTKDNRDELKKEASQNTNVEYVSLEEIKSNIDYQAGLGTVVYGDDGQPHKINHDGVAAHPSDLGMKYIADKIIEKLQ